MFVEFVSQKEIDLPEAPNGYSWRGNTTEYADVITLIGVGSGGFGYVSPYPSHVSAVAYDAMAVPKRLGTFATPREAAEALFAALGLEVQP